MKKIFTTILICMLFLCSTTIALANVILPSPEFELQYSDADNFFSTFLIDNSGEATISVVVRLQNNSTVDNVEGTLRIVNINTGNVPVTWRNISFSEYISRSFTYRTNYKILNSGTYMLDGTLYLYDGSVLKETIPLKPILDSF